MTHREISAIIARAERLPPNRRIRFLKDAGLTFDDYSRHLRRETVKILALAAVGVVAVAWVLGATWVAR